MPNDDIVTDADKVEHLDTNGCCECGSTKHVCQDCPTFTDADEVELERWQVTLTNTFEATSARDAIGQMATYCVDYAFQAGYRVDRLKGDGTVGTSEFIDAERFDFNEPNDD